MLTELNTLFKLIWQKKKCCDNKSWKSFFLHWSTNERFIEHHTSVNWPKLL